jgi:hypothetical protein
VGLIGCCRHLGVMLLDRQGPFPEMVVATTVTVRIGGPDGESQSGVFTLFLLLSGPATNGVNAPVPPLARWMVIVVLRWL